MTRPNAFQHTLFDLQKRFGRAALQPLSERETATALSTGFAALDTALLAGGLRRGALTGAVLAYAYSLAFLVYAVVRESVSVLNVGADDGGMLLLSNALSLGVVVLVFGTVMALLCALIGALTEVVLLAALRRMITDYQTTAAVLTGVGVTLVIALLIHLLTGLMPNPRLNLAYPETYLFWLGVPTVIYIIAGALRGGEINTRTA